VLRRSLAATLVLGVIAASCGDSGPSLSEVLEEGSLSIDGAGLTTYPAFDPATERYAIRTDDTSTGELTVTPEFDDAEITVDGVGAEGPIDLTGVEPGDEFDVTVAVGDDVTTYTFVPLPAAFPEIEADTTGDTADGHVFLTLRRLADPVVWETVIDDNGVPVYMFATEAPSSDLKPQANGTYTVAREIPRDDEGQPTHEIVVLDADFEEVDTLTNVNLVNTDDHDAIVREDGSRILMAYEPDLGDDGPDDDLWHSDLEEVGSDGEVVFEWSSRDHIPLTDNVTENSIDYAHINGVSETADGDLIASFRNTSQVMKIDHATGEVIWRLGGISNDFTFVDDPYGGPCAQHHAQELANGNILLWDNGSEADEDFLPNAGDLCPNPDDPDGPRIARAFSRAVEYAIDTDAMTATLVWSHDRDEEVYGPFTGSVQRLDNGNTIMSWGTTTFGSSPTSLVSTEIDDSGETVWSLRALGADGNGDYFSYRVYRYPLLDSAAPTEG
jgi:hypothetical protein